MLRRPGKLGQPRSIAPGGSPESSSDSLTVIRYPAAIDNPPTVSNAAGANPTPLSAQYDNYLAQMVMAIQAELGPLGTGTSSLFKVGGQDNLMKMLGIEGAMRLSVVIGTDAGKMFGLQYYTTLLTGNYVGANPPNAVDITATHGLVNPARNPASFGCAIYQGQSSNLPDTGPWVVRTEAYHNSTTNTRMLISAVNKGSARTSGGDSFTFEFLLFYFLDTP